MIGSSSINTEATKKLEQLKQTCQTDNPTLFATATALFLKAPAEYVERSSVAAIHEISQHVHTFYQRFQSSDAAFLVSVENIRKSDTGITVTAICAATSDRPFIIDSLTETLASLGLQHHVLLHPIIDEEGELTSLVYIELPCISDTEVHQSITKEITRVFTHLLLATDDFQAMLTRCNVAASALQEVRSTTEEEALDIKELSAFIDWLCDGNFVFLGCREWEKGDGHPSPVVGKDLGYFLSNEPNAAAHLGDLRRDAELLFSSDSRIHCSKSLLYSDIHKRCPLDTITVKIPFDSNGSKQRCITFVGMLTSKATNLPALAVPLVRRKVRSILEREGLAPNTHDYKEVISIADNIARDDLLRYPRERFRQEIAQIFDLQRRNEVRVSSFLLPLHRFYSVNVVVPRGRFSREMRQRIQRYLERQLGVPDDSSEYHLTFTDYPLVVLRLLIPNATLQAAHLDLAKCEQAIQEMTLTWDDRLRLKLCEKLEEHDAEELFRAYRNVFPDEYKAIVSPEEAIRDISCLATLSESRQLEVSLAPVEGGGRSYQLKLFRWGTRFTLSGIIPFLENIGFEVEDEVVTSIITPRGDWNGIYNLRVAPRRPISLSDAQIRETILPAIRLIFSGDVENDRLNALVLNPGLTIRQVALLRTLLNYLWQIKATASRGSGIEALTNNVELAQTLVEYFVARFDPELQDRDTIVARLNKQFDSQIKQVRQLTFDRTLRALRNTIDAALRTNYFQPQSGFRIAFKVRCETILQMPEPRPLVEIFVNAPHLEGVHLRGGLVARGGLRWSERKEDFRTEILGLMKTQMVKNSIIVPVGAKGGFLVKKRVLGEPISREDVENTYIEFIRSLLEISDNVVNGEIVPPPSTVRYDDPDPYLVVAADRGTATFSDVANNLATTEFNFWLGDAFASGGSNGYDHKKLGITARGAWESVARHFREIGLDITRTPFTVVGIGDMSGDVFGNGMLLSRNLKLIGAFNHKHIFIDPTPDPESSFIERERLFTMPHSQWSDYDATKLSAGGAIYDRSEKEIHLSPEAMKALDIEMETISGEELIRAILRAPVDLLWNGGIGTYIKSSEEENLSVSDRANDDVRIDARDCRAKVIGEGGNLGLTQKARIEYSRIGGHLNTDAVDNSGGVDLSDLEVNIKILLSQPVKRGELSLEDRNALLEELAQECSNRIVARNRTQSRIISLSVRRSRRNLGYYRGLLNSLEDSGALVRKAETLPDDETLEKRVTLRAGLLRPELSVLIAYTRMSLKESMLASSLPDEPFLQHFAINYFPVSLRKRFEEDILSHPLRREIISTQVVNLLLERMGASFVYRTAEETGASTTEIITAFLLASEILDAYTLTIELETLDSTNTARLYLTTLIKISNALDGMTRWMLENRNPDLSLDETAAVYKPVFASLSKQTRSLLTDAEAHRFEEGCKQLISHGLRQELAQQLIALSFSSAFLDIIEIARTSEKSPALVAGLYAQVSIATQVQDLLARSSEIEPADRWESLALRSVMIDLRRTVARISSLVISVQGEPSEESLSEFLEVRSESFTRYLNSVRESKKKPLNIATILVIANQLAALHRH